MFAWWVLFVSQSRSLGDKEKEQNLKRITEATENVEFCDYKIAEAQNELDKGIDLQAREAKKTHQANIRTLEEKKDSELKLMEILKDQNENGVEPKEEVETDE